MSEPMYRLYRYSGRTMDQLTPQQQLEEARDMARALNPTNEEGYRLMLAWQCAEYNARRAATRKERAAADHAATLAMRAYLVHKRGKGFYAP